MIGWFEGLVDSVTSLASGHLEFLVGVVVGILIASLFASGRRLS